MQFLRNFLFGMLALVVGLLSSLVKRKHRRRRSWVRPWVSKRSTRGVYNSLLRELRAGDPAAAQNFLRMSDSAFSELLHRVGPAISKRDTTMRQAIRTEERLALTLRFLATGDSYASLQYLYRIPKSTISQIIPEVCEALYNALVDEYMKVPTKTHEWLNIERDFRERWNLPHCVGALDGKHVHITAPAGGASLFYNYKKFHSVVFMALVDADYSFLAVDVGYNGRMSDRGIYNRSPIHSVIGSDAYGWPSSTSFPGFNGALPYFIVADDAFPLEENIMKPYSRRQLERSELVFNYRISRARRVVENAFGVLSARFRVLRRPLSLKLKTVDKVILACCVLHNFLRKHHSSRQLYSPITAMDLENIDAGELQPGSWRSDRQPNQLRPLGKQGSNRPKTDGRYVQDRLHDYVNGAGRVSWQDRMVDLRLNRTASQAM